MTDEEKRKRLRYLQLKAKAAESEAPEADAQAAPAAPPAEPTTIAGMAGKALGSVPGVAGDALRYSLGVSPEARAAMRGLVQGGTLGFGDEIAGAISSALPKSAARWMNTPLGGDSANAPTDYGAARDMYRSLNRQDREASPKSYLAGEVVGGTAVPIPGGGAKAATALGRAAKAARTGALLSGAYGAGQSEGATAADVVKDSLTAALGGAGLGAVGSGLATAASPLARSLEKYGLQRGRRALLNGADQLSSREVLPDDVVKEAIDSGAIRAFGTTKGAAERLGALTDRVGNAYGKMLGEMERRGVQGPRAQEVADRLMSEAGTLRPRTMNEALPDILEGAAAQVKTKLPAGAERLGLSQAEELKRSLQKMARYGKLEETPQNEVRREIASIMRDANERAVAEAGRAPGASPEVRAMAEAFVPAKQRLGRLMDAEAAASRGAARVSQRGALSLPDYLAAIGGGAAAGPAGMGLGIANNLLRNRGNSTAAVMSTAMANALRSSSPNAVAALMPALAPALMSRPKGALRASEDEEVERRLMLADALRRR